VFNSGCSANPIQAALIQNSTVVQLQNSHQETDHCKLLKIEKAAATL